MDVLCFVHWLSLAHFRISNACNFLISGQKHKVWVLFSYLDRKEYFGNELSRSAEIFTFSTICPMISALIWRNVRQRMTSLRIKLYIIKRKFKFLEWICHLFHLMKRENEYFMRGFATHEICIFRFTRWNKWHIHSKHLNILYLLNDTPSLSPSLQAVGCFMLVLWHHETYRYFFNLPIIWCADVWGGPFLPKMYFSFHRIKFTYLADDLIFYVIHVKIGIQFLYNTCIIFSLLKCWAEYLSNLFIPKFETTILIIWLNLSENVMEHYRLHSSIYISQFRI